MVSLSLRNVCLDYPLYGAYDFSIKRRLLGRLVKKSGKTQIESGPTAANSIFSARHLNFS